MSQKKIEKLIEEQLRFIEHDLEDYIEEETIEYTEECEEEDELCEEDEL